MKKFLAFAICLLWGVILSPVYGQQVKEQVDLTLNNGVRFVGVYSYFPGTAAYPQRQWQTYTGTLYYPNGDTEKGSFNPNWRPSNTNNTDYHRASDNKDLIKYYEYNGNVRFVEINKSAPSSGNSAGGGYVPMPQPQQQQTEMCRVCSGSGKCSNCHGSGISPNHAPGIVARCGACSGSGKCTTCHGLGHH